MRHIVVLCDYGLDDAAATVDLLDNGSVYSTIDILPIGGNVPVDVSYRNVFRLLSHYPGDISKVRIVDTTEIPQPNEYLKEIHGEDGMGDLFSTENMDLAVPILQYSDWVKTLPEDVLVLSLGPMTVVKDIFQTAGPRELVLMGGCINEEPNFNGYEFNHCLDREAFTYCLQYPHIAITLDTCRNPLLNIEKRIILGDDVLSQIMRRDQVLGVQRKEIGCYVWDDIAVKYLHHPEWFEKTLGVDRDGNSVTTLKYIRENHYLDI